MRRLPWTLAWARLHKYSLRSTAMAGAVALALLALLALQGISRSTSDDLVTYTLSKLPIGDRALTLTSSQIDPSQSDYADTTAYLSKHLSSLAENALTREILYHEISDPHGVGFYFGGVDALSRSVSLISGRLPNRCTPTLCEVLQIGGMGQTPPAVQNLGLVIVGNAVLGNKLLFAGTMAPDPGVPLLVTQGVLAATKPTHFQNLQGANGWVGTINLNRIAKVGSDAYISTMLAFENQLSIDHSELTLTWPQDSLNEAGIRAKELSNKFVLLNYVIGALLVAFLILFSLRHKKEYSNFRSALSRIGTPTHILVSEWAVEYSAPIALGVVTAVTASPALPVALRIINFHASLAQIYNGWEQYIFLLIAAVAFTIATSMLGDRAWRKRVWIPGLLGFAFLTLYFLRSGVGDTKMWSTPFAFALLPSLLSFAILRTTTKVWRKRRHHTYVILREYLRMWQGVCAILTIATILAILTLCYDSGISQKVNSQAIDTVPLDVTLKTGNQLIRPLDLGGVQRYEQLAPGTTAYPVLRSGTSVRSQSVVSDSLTLVGVPRSALSHIPGMTSATNSFGSRGAMIEKGIEIGLAKQLQVRLTNIPQEVDLFGWFRTPNGTHENLAFSGHGERRTLELSGQIPAGSLLVAFEFRETSDYLSRRLHAIGEGSFSVPVLKGVGSINSIGLDGVEVAVDRAAWGLENFDYAFNGDGLMIRPAVKEFMPAVIVDPATSELAKNGLLTLNGEGDRYFQVKIGSIQSHFPTAGDRFVIMDLGELQSEIGRYDLGAIDPIELWISTSSPSIFERNLIKSGLKGLDFQSQVQVRKELRSDPANIGLDSSYKTALLFALLVAIFMYSTSLPLVYKEGSKLFFQLEAEGATPTQLRRSLRLALRTTTSVGLAVGLLLGLLTSPILVSRSVPYLLIALVSLSVVAVEEIGSILLMRNFLSSQTMGGRWP